MKDSLGDRMKRHEAASKTCLTRRLPAILRVDGKAFHTLTSDMQRPWDSRFTALMQETARHLCTEVQGAQLAYVQSDEISLLITDYTNHETEAWFDYSIQKVVSVAAGMASSFFARRLYAYGSKYIQAYPCFDARVFSLPEAEVCNYFIWRQQDATRNSIQMLARAHFSHKECNNLSCDQLQEKLFQELGINWNDTPATHKRGSCVARKSWLMTDGTERTEWSIDQNIPIFTADRTYITSRLPQESTDAK